MFVCRFSAYQFFAQKAAPSTLFLLVAAPLCWYDRLNREFLSSTESRYANKYGEYGDKHNRCNSDTSLGEGLLWCFLGFFCFQAPVLYVIVEEREDSGWVAEQLLLFTGRVAESAKKLLDSLRHDIFRFIGTGNENLFFLDGRHGFYFYLLLKLMYGFFKRFKNHETSTAACKHAVFLGSRVFFRFFFLPPSYFGTDPTTQAPATRVSSHRRQGRWCGVY